MPNLKIIVDRNHLQSDGYKDEITVKTLRANFGGVQFPRLMGMSMKYYL